MFTLIKLNNVTMVQCRNLLKVIDFVRRDRSCLFGICCQKNGTFISRSSNIACTVSFDECKQETVCDRSSAHCPELPKPNGSPCSGTSRICKDGTCKESACIKYGFMDCNCNYRSCEICCRRKVDDSCRLASDLGLRIGVGKIYRRKVGEFCTDGRGYCSEEGRCVRLITAPLSERIKDDVTVEINTWLMQNWMLTIVIALIILYIIKLRLFRRLEDDSLLLQHFFMEVRKTRHILGFFPKAQEASRYMEDGIVQLSRLVALFPTVSLEIHGDCVRQIGVEEEIVKMFLSNGVPIREEFVEKIVYPKLRRGIVIPARKAASSSSAGPSGIKDEDKIKSSVDSSGDQSNNEASSDSQEREDTDTA